MKKCDIFRTLNPHSKPVSIGIWPYDDKLYFTIEELSPQNFVDSDTLEFPISINGFEIILKEAKRLTTESSRHDKRAVDRGG